MDLITLTDPLRKRRWFGYVFGVFAVLAALGVRTILGDAAYKFPFVIFLPPVILTAFIGGSRAGIAAATMAGIVADLTLIAPRGSVWPVWPEGWIAMAFYILTVSVDIGLIHAMTHSFRRAVAAESELRLLNEELELRVSTRTAALESQITEREAAQAQVRQLQKMEAVGQLTGGIAHDFNNMLAVVIGSLEMARRRKADPTRVMNYIDNAEEGARRAAQLTARLLAFSRQQPLAPEVLDANRLVAGMSKLLHRTIAEAVQVETSLGRGLWRTFADPGQLENALLNLAVNARDAMPAGGKLTIKTANTVLDAAYVRAHADVAAGEYVLITVTDQGVGMPPEVLSRAFEPFYTTKEPGKGTGLGLSQVYGFIKQSGGHVSIHSSIVEGTVVRVYLPRHLDEVAVAVPVVDGHAQRSVANELILVVEDEATVRQISVEALQELGYAVIEAADARQALDLLTSRPDIGLLFTDIVMPDMNGHQLAQHACERLPDLRVLYTTGYAPDAVIQSEPHGLTTALLPKPFTIEQLAAKVRDVLDGAPRARA